MGWFKRSQEGIKTSTQEKKETPEGLWFKCPKCKTVATTEDHEANLFVCEICAYHSRIGSEEYFQLVFDDGIYAAARLLEILDQEEDEPQAVFDTLPKGVSTPELKVHMEEGAHYEFIKKFVEHSSFPDAKVTTIDGIRADYSDGWGLVRCSNTTPCLVIRFDSDNQRALERIQQDFKTKLWAIDDSLELPF